MEIVKILNYLIKRDSGSIKLLYDDLSNYLNKEQLYIIKLKMRGYKNIEVAKKLKVCPATITIRLVKIRAILKKEYLD